MLKHVAASKRNPVICRSISETEAALKAGLSVHLVQSAWFKRRRRNAANPCGVRRSDGGRERSRTSDPYSVNVVLYR